MAKRAPKKQQRDPGELMREMRTKGIEHVVPITERPIRLRTVDAAELLRKGDVPDILTPLVIKAVYTEPRDREVQEFLNQTRARAEDALKMADTIDYVCKASIMDNTKLEDLTIGEKRWIFRVAMGPAELLIPFRDEEDADVGTVGEGKDVPPASE